MARTTLICGDSTKWNGHADLILTNPYGPLPECLVGVPAIVTNFTDRKEQVESWVKAPLTSIGTWSSRDCTVWVANVDPVPVNTTDCIEEEYKKNHGWFPLELPLRLLKQYGRGTVWDGFMGRGTVGRACQILELDFIGIDIDPTCVALARKYIAS